MKNSIYLLLTIVCGLLAACSSTTYRIQSSPSEADVEMTMKSGQRKSLGKTPISVSAQEVNPNRESFQVEIKKEGAGRQNVFVPESAFGKNLDLNVNLPGEIRGADGKRNDVVLNEVASAVADIQKDIQVKNFELALTKVNRMISDYPMIATFHSLAGNVHYLERRLDKALASYKKALELNPNSGELQKVIDKLNAMNGGSR